MLQFYQRGRIRRAEAVWLAYLTGFYLESTACQQFAVLNIFVQASLACLQLFVSGYKYLILERTRYPKANMQGVSATRATLPCVSWWAVN